MFLSLIVLQLHFSCSPDTAGEVSPSPSPEEGSKCDLFPKRECFSPLNFHGHKCHVLRFLIAIGLKIISFFLSSGKSVREKGESLGERAPACPTSRVHQQLCQHQHPAGSQHCNASSWGCASPRSLLEHQRFHQLGQKGGRVLGMSQHREAPWRIQGDSREQATPSHSRKDKTSMQRPVGAAGS